MTAHGVKVVTGSDGTRTVMNALNVLGAAGGNRVGALVARHGLTPEGLRSLFLELAGDTDLPADDHVFHWAEARLERIAIMVDELGPDLSDEAPILFVLVDMGSVDGYVIRTDTIPTLVELEELRHESEPLHVQP